ncbi:hypothetical protein, partial [Nonomuraea rhodomycinica]
MRQQRGRVVAANDGRHPVRRRREPPVSVERQVRPHVRGQGHHRFRVARPDLTGLRVPRHQGDVRGLGGQAGPGQDEVAFRWPWREQAVSEALDDT